MIDFYLMIGKVYWIFVLIVIGKTFVLYPVYAQNTELNSSSESATQESMTLNVSEDENIETNNLTNNDTSFYSDPTKVSKPATGSYLFFFVRALFILILFSVISYFLIRFIKKRTNNVFAPKKGPIRVLFNYPIGVGKSLMVLEVVNEYIVVSNTQSNVEFLMRLEDKETIDLFKLEGDKVISEGNPFFADVFKKYIKTDKVEGSLSVTKKLKERINKN